LGLVGVGEDTGGSIRIPASFNNLFGLRVTTGLISRTGFSPLVGWIRAGTLKYRETILDGIERVPDAFIDMLRGNNTGKMLVRLQHLS
ncbi:amidase family protein, partial [Mycobacterium sp.]|uniref:amidase family protein n=1 Tax=Mycobacterium sp. TaxID=1785 RepID=UPI0028B510EF|nr:amiE [Mycobacterium sp.]MDT5056952.1 amidase [Mycobacterium sp.]